MTKNVKHKLCICLFDDRDRHWINAKCIIHSGKRDFTCGKCSAGSPQVLTSGETSRSQDIPSEVGLSASRRTCSGSRTALMRWHGR